MIPHERSLVENLKDKPFALLGVNSDREKNIYFKEAAKLGVNWRSFWCGEKGGAGAIPAEWRIHTWPTMFLIDGNGVIRQRWIGVPDNDKVDEAINALIAELEQDK